MVRKQLSFDTDYSQREGIDVGAIVDEEKQKLGLIKRGINAVKKACGFSTEQPKTDCQFNNDGK